MYLFLHLRCLLQQIIIIVTEKIIFPLSMWRYFPKVKKEQLEIDLQEVGNRRNQRYWKRNRNNSNNRKSMKFNDENENANDDDDDDAASSNIGLVVRNGKLVLASPTSLSKRKQELRSKYLNERKNDAYSYSRKQDSLYHKRQDRLPNKNSKGNMISKRDTSNHGNRKMIFKQTLTSRINENQLVLSTDVPADSDKILVFHNLTLGVDQESLKKILQTLVETEVAKIRVRDLPNGSSIANIWLANNTLIELERVRDHFHKATVDGREISVLIAADPSNTLAY
ncbi:uncharacterized protein NDAI_0F03010 [Naumovozyma dairenensis CBS 421]|uniref:RRM domain-containing protein n=1 Tax=Naumovozyma dairenensis (strain ATCC 10597 / BCRC 20456 / CBS 421 / NBRC 0211 / NRRL Y-12639) TaxID=1071378 RepID=G0WCV8_NAUDC|nr:hypothetical protein NDAI_0F03010 [Naumovozyma dairenensis CBS 421]CCD25619.1 hypothetical protein NDAI_0F03010 [Naumovozyma dairenensis CBS 421]